MAEKFLFHYVYTAVGTLSGQSFITQTEDAINDLARYASEGNADATEALRLAKIANDNSETALNNSSQAVSTANSALSQVKTLTTTVESWNKRIQTAESNAATAVSTANAAKSSAESAVTTANSALAIAGEAKQNSSDALAIAQQADKNSTFAVSKATDAAATADEAKKLAQQAVIDAGSTLVEMEGLLATTTAKATEAALSAQDASSSALQAQNSSLLAEKWASWMSNSAAEGQPEDFTVDGTEYSSKWYATKASESASVASDASTSATAAADSAGASATGAVSVATPVTKGDITSLGIPAQDTTYAPASGKKDGLMSAAHFTKLEGVEAKAQVNVIEKVSVNGSALPINSKGVNIDLTPYALRTDITNVYKFKGSVENFEALPKTALTAGDVYDVKAAHGNNPAGTNFAWTGTKWDPLGGAFHVDAIATSAIDALFA